MQEILRPDTTLQEGAFGANWHLLVDETADAPDGLVIASPLGSSTQGGVGFPSPTIASPFTQLKVRFRARKTGASGIFPTFSILNNITAIGTDLDFVLTSAWQTFEGAWHAGPWATLDLLRVYVSSSTNVTTFWEIDWLQLVVENAVEDISYITLPSLAFQPYVYRTPIGIYPY